jgi:phosphoribosyl 1,2-cyclic phosphodiesterase
MASLGSGSKGNSLIISARKGAHCTCIMLDCGFGIRETERRLARNGISPSDLSAIVLTHEHGDHAGGAFRFAQRHRLPIWMSAGTFQALEGRETNVEVSFCHDGEPFSIGDMQLIPFTVPHNAREPLQFCITDGNHKLGVLTDTGRLTAHLCAALKGCSTLMIECNHDVDMLEKSSYPSSLKQRIRGEWGHLSNDDTVTLLKEISHPRLKKVVGAHVSQQSNTYACVQATLENAVNQYGSEVVVATQEEGFGWLNMD